MAKPTKEQMIKWAEDGMTATDIAEMLNIAYRTVVNYRKQYGLSSPKKSTKRPTNDELNQLLKTHSVKKIAEMLGAGKSTVYYWCKEARGSVAREEAAKVCPPRISDAEFNRRCAAFRSEVSMLSRSSLGGNF